MANPQTFNIEHQYQIFLQRIGLTEAAMAAQQKAQLKHTFFGAWGQLLDCLESDVAELPELTAVSVLEHMKRQVQAYFDAVTTAPKPQTSTPS